MDNNSHMDLELLLAEERRRAVERRLLAEVPSHYRRVCRRERKAVRISAVVVAAIAVLNVAAVLHSRQHPHVLCDGSAVEALASADRMLQDLSTAIS